MLRIHKTSTHSYKLRKMQELMKTLLLSTPHTQSINKKGLSVARTPSANLVFVFLSFTFSEGTGPFTSHIIISNGYAFEL